jgi:outer membrane protein TolC
MQTNSPMMAFGSILNQRAFDFELDFNNPGTIDNLNATGTVAYNLYSGGRREAGVEAAEAGKLAAEYDEQAALQQLAAQAVKAYLDIRKATEAVAAVEAGVNAYKAAVEVARARFDAGNMLRADLLSLEVQLAQTRENLVAARHGKALAERAFLFVLGLEAAGEPVEILADDPFLDQITRPDSCDFSRRPELIGMNERMRAADAMVRLARGSGRPTVNAFASYQYDYGWTLDNGADSWAAGIAVDFNIFDGGTAAARVRRNEAELQAISEMLRRATLGISLEVEHARLSYEQTIERLDVTATAVEQADESAALSRARFEEGALLTADLIGVEGRLIEARMRRAVAEADERTALAELRRALGLEPLQKSIASESES